MMCDQETYSFPFGGQNIEVRLEYEIYSNNHSLAVLLKCGDELEEDFGYITVNLDPSGTPPFGEQFLDVNNYPQIAEWLEENQLAEPVGQVVANGYVHYPLYRFRIPPDLL